MIKPYLALLRGINVGGKNKIPMAALKTCLEELGCRNVQTYIVSGNVLFESDQNIAALADEIERTLPKRFTLDSDVVKILLLTHEQLKRVINQAPKGFGTEPGTYHSDVIFLMGIPPSEALSVFDPREGVDKIWAGDLAIYSQRVSVLRTKSRLGKIVGTPPYKSMTIRSWNTTIKLLQLMDAAAKR